MRNIIAILALLTFVFNSVAETITKEGNTFVATKTTKVKKESENKETSFTYKDTKGVEHKVYESKKGIYYILLTSKNGNEYKKYFPKEKYPEMY